MDEIKNRINHLYNTYYSNKIINKCLNFYDKKIEDFLEDNKSFSKGLLQLLYISSNIIMRKEETIEEIANKYELKVNKQLIDGLLNQIADEPLEDGKCIIDGFNFKSPIDFINTIRNKFAHGFYDYDVSKKIVSIKVSGNTIKLQLEWLCIFNRLVFVEISKTKTDGYYTEGVIKIQKNSFSHIENDKGFKRSLLDMKYYEFVITPKDSNKEYDQYENGIISKLIEKVCDDFNNFRNCDNSVKTIRKYCDSKDLNMKLNIIPVSNFSKEEKEKLRNMYHNCVDFNSFDIGAQVQMIAQWIMDIRLNKNTIDHISQGYTVIQDFIDYLDYNKSYMSFVKSSPKSLLYYDKCIVAMLLAHFNIVYAYNAETLYEKHLDYSKLDLSKIKYSINKFEDLELNSIENELKSLKIRIDNAIISRDNVQNNLNKLLCLINENGSENLNHAKGKEVLTEKLNLEQIKLDNLIDIQKNMMNKKNDRVLEIEFRKEHYENKNIINHIRNSLAHGNFKVERFGKKGSFGNMIIHFQDIYMNENTFDSSISLEDFASLFSSENYKIIFDMCFTLATNKDNNAPKTYTVKSR